MEFAETGPRGVTARVVAVLSSFAKGQSELGITQISRETGLALSTTHRLVSELTRCGALTQTARHRYTVGPKVADLASAIRRHSGPTGPTPGP